MDCSMYDKCTKNSDNLTPYERQKLARDCYYANPINIIEPFALSPFWKRLILVLASLFVAIFVIYAVINYTPIGGQKIIDIKYPTFTSSDISGISDLPSFLK